MKVALTVAVAAVVGWAVQHLRERHAIPLHLLNHPALSVPDLLSETDAQRLRDLAVEMGSAPGWCSLSQFAIDVPHVRTAGMRAPTPAHSGRTLLYSLLHLSACHYTNHPFTQLRTILSINRLLLVDVNAVLVAMARPAGPKRLPQMPPDHPRLVPCCVLTTTLHTPLTFSNPHPLFLINAGGFPCNTDDVKFYHAAREDIGEAVPLTDAKEGCKHPFLVPNNNRTLCVLPGRIDIGRHFVLTGGLQGLKESHERLVSRILSFGR
jgi:hypothetical protein